MQVSHLAVFGPGLIGGSLALAARKRQACARMSIWSQDPAEREAARKLQLAEVVTDDPAEAVCGADLVILCVPPAAMVGLASKIAPALEENAVATDVASVKGSLVAELTEIFRGRGKDAVSAYVGGHPMAGAEMSGLASAQEDLFAGCVCLLTPLDGCTKPEAIERVSQFWQKLGMRVRRMSPQAHDEAVALVSHLPHALAAGLTRYVGGLRNEALECTGPGWRDMTRLAGGSPEMWTEILSRNRRPVTNALHGIIGQLQEVLELLEAGRDPDLETFLTEAKQWRDDASSSTLARSVAENQRT